MNTRLLSSPVDSSDVRVWGENADRFFADAEAMIRWIDQPSIVPFLACVREECTKGNSGTM